MTLSHRIVPLLLLAAAACSKTEGGGAGGSATATSAPSEAPTIRITGTPSAAASAVPSASAAVSVAAPTTAAAAAAQPAASAAATARAIASAVPATSTSATAKDPPLEPAASHVSGKNFALDLVSPGCRAGSPCAMAIRLTASGAYHVNKEYPYKFIASATPGVDFLGAADANTFSRAAGDFKEEAEKVATMSVRFKAQSPGPAKVTGTYKMSVCSAENCQIEQQTVTLSIPVK